MKRKEQVNVGLPWEEDVKCGIQEWFKGGERKFVTTGRKKGDE